MYQSPSRHLPSVLPSSVIACQFPDSQSVAGLTSPWEPNCLGRFRSMATRGSGNEAATEGVVFILWVIRM